MSRYTREIDTQPAAPKGPDGTRDDKVVGVIHLSAIRPDGSLDYDIGLLTADEVQLVLRLMNGIRAMRSRA